jgi:hypothetical protein
MSAAVEPLFQIQVQCPCCGKSFKTSRVRPSFRKSVGRDADFCIHYKDLDNNPDYYVVRVCPFCGFASTENSKTTLLERHKSEYREKIGNHWTGKDYGGKRTWADALQCYKLALLCFQLTEESDRVIAGILHHIAWLYRYKQDWEQEQRFLRYAKEAYIRVYETEGEVNNARLMFLIGEISRRLKEYDDAVKWFARVINDKRIMDSAMIQASREQWMVTRENMLEDKLELPEEMRSTK